MTKLEKCERAIRAAVFATYGHILVNGGTELTRAVVTELLSPDEGMLDELADLVRPNVPRDLLKSRFSRAIQHILKEGEG